MGAEQVGGREGQEGGDKAVIGLGGGQEHKQNKQRSGEHKQQISTGQRLEEMGRRELQLEGGGGKRRRLESALNPAGRVASGAGDIQRARGDSPARGVTPRRRGESHTLCWERALLPGTCMDEP